MDGADEDVFIHFSAIQRASESEFRSLTAGQPVTFDIEVDEAGRQRATNVRKLDECGSGAESAVKGSGSSLAGG